VSHRIKRLLAAILSLMRIESASLTGTATKIAATAAAGFVT
jgi:two-component sensor histidine kinase